MTTIEQMRIDVQELKLGMAIIELSKRHKNIGVFSVLPDKDFVRWTKSMFFMQRIKDAIFDASWNGKMIKDPLEYNAILLIDFKFNHKINEIKFKKTTSNLVGFGGFVPVIKIDYCLTGDNFCFERDCNYIRDGISAATAKLGLRKSVQDS